MYYTFFCLYNLNYILLAIEIHKANVVFHTIFRLEWSIGNYPVGTPTLHHRDIL